VVASSDRRSTQPVGLMSEHTVAIWSDYI